MTGEKNSQRQFRIDFQTSIITVFVGVVLLVGLTLVYLSFERVTSITRNAAFEIIMCKRWDEVFAAIAQDGAADNTLVRLSGFLHDYPKDGIAEFHARRFRAAARNTGAAA